MKKYLSVIFLCLLLSWESYAVVQIKPGLALSQGSNSYLIKYTNNNINVKDTILTGENGEYKFSYVELTPDYYDYVGMECCPSYPAYTLHLELPQNATNVQVHVHNIEYTRVGLNFPYLPVQSSITGFPEIVCRNHNLYNDSYLMDQYYHDWYLLSMTYTRLVARGVNFSIYPVHYHLPDIAEVMTSAEFEITYEGSPLSTLYQYLNYTSAHFFDNYIGREHYLPMEPVIDGEPYLIITERQYENYIDDFRNHKESLGYHVFVNFVEDIGNTPEAIRTRIISYYTGCKLKYVLLAGSLHAIPFSSGEEDNYWNPPTDIYYTCLDNIHIEEQNDYHPHVFLGRWDVRNSDELSTVIKKTIRSELSMYGNNSHKMASFSGTDSPKLSNIAQARWIKTNVIDESSYLCGHFYDGRNATTSPFTYEDMKVEIEDRDNPLWMYMYFGHGSYSWMANPYCFDYYDINNCVNSDLPYQPFGFSFACSNGDLYKNTCFSRYWMNVKNGGIGMMAATESTIIECNRWFSRKLFSPLVDYQPLMTIGELIANAKERYYYADQVPYRRRHIAKYIYLGDPSLYIHGLDIYHVHHFAPTRESSFLEDADPYKVKILSINGILLEELLYSEFQNRTYPSGMYLIQLFDESDNLIDVIKTIR